MLLDTTAYGDSTGSAGLGIAFLFFIIIGIVLYFIPTIIAFKRDTPNKLSVLVINLFFGWSFIGWVISLAMAFGNKNSGQQVVNVYNNPGAYPQQQPLPPGHLQGPSGQWQGAPPPPPAPPGI